MALTDRRRSVGVRPIGSGHAIEAHDRQKTPRYAESIERHALRRRGLVTA